MIFRDGSCLSCRYPVPFHDWASVLQMLEALLPHTDYVPWKQIAMCHWPYFVTLYQIDQNRFIDRNGFVLHLLHVILLCACPCEIVVLCSSEVRISLFVDKGLPVVNEVEYTSGGLEVIPVPIARDWTLQWLEGYYKFLS